MLEFTKGVKTCVTAGMGRAICGFSCPVWEGPETLPVIDPEPGRKRVTGLTCSYGEGGVALGDDERDDEGDETEDLLLTDKSTGSFWE